jgi:hypothetical protein
MSISMGDFEELAGSSSKAAKNGFLDTGRLPLGGVYRAGEGITGDAALSRKGLLEDRLSDPGEGRRSIFVWDISVFVTKSIFETDENGLPGIDGSAIMIVPPVLSLLHTQSQQTSQEPEGRMRWSLEFGCRGFPKGWGSHKIGGTDPV